MKHCNGLQSLETIKFTLTPWNHQYYASSFTLAVSTSMLLGSVLSSLYQLILELLFNPTCGSVTFLGR